MQWQYYSLHYNSMYANLSSYLVIANKVWGKVMFYTCLSVILFTGGCVCLWIQGVYTPLEVHPLDTHHPTRHTLPDTHPHPRHTPTLDTHLAVEMAIEAGGTHPTGMYFCMSSLLEAKRHPYSRNSPPRRVLCSWWSLL